MFSRTKTFIKSRSQPPQQRTIPEQLADQSELIEKLRATISQLEVDIHRLRDEFSAGEVRDKERGEGIATLRRDLEPLRPLPQALAEKDAQLASIQAALPSLTRRVGEQERELAAQTKSLGDVRRAVAPLEQRLTDLDGRLNESRALAAEHAEALALLQPLHALPETIDEHHSRIEALQTGIPQLERRMAEHDATLHKLGQEQLEANLSHVQELNEQADAIATLGAELEALRVLPVQLAEQHARIDRLGARLPALEGRVDAQEGEARRLHSRLDAAGAHVDGLEHAIAGLTAQVEPLHVLPTLVVQLGEAVPALEQRVSAQAQDADRLRAELDAGRAAQERHAAELATLAAEMEPLRPLPSQISELRDTIPPLEQRISEEEIRVQRLEYELTQTAAEHSQGLQAHADGISALKSAVEPLHPLPQQLSECWELVDQVRGTAASLERRISEQDRESRRLKEQLGARKTDADGHAEAIAALNGEIDALRPLPDRLSEHGATLSSLRDTMTPLEQRLAQQEQRSQELADADRNREFIIKQQADALATRESEMEQLKAELSALRQAQSKVTDELHDEQTRVQSQATTIEEQDAQIKELLSSGTELIAQVKAQETQMSELREALNAAEMKLNSQAEFSSQIQKKLSAIEAKLEPKHSRESSAESDQQGASNKPPSERPGGRMTPTRRSSTQPLPWYMQRYSSTGTPSNSSSGATRF